MKMLKIGHVFARKRKNRVTHIKRSGQNGTLCGQSVSATSTDRPSKKKPLCKRCEKQGDIEKVFEKEIQVEPCPKCGNDGIRLYNCGYSSFNPGGGECPDCGFKVQKYVDWNASLRSMATIWNKRVKAHKEPDDKLKKERLKTRRLRKQLRELGEEPVS